MAIHFESKPKRALSKAYLKKPVDRADLARFRDQLMRLYAELNRKESEEHVKNQMADFLKATFYGLDYQVNTKDKTDLAITDNGTAKVLLEVKHPDNQAEMVTVEKPNAKALHQLLLYFLRERVAGKNLDLKHLVVTNVDEWFVFDAKDFENLAIKDKELVRKFQDFETGNLPFSDTADFYREIAKPWFEAHADDLPGTNFSLRQLADFLAEDSTNLEPLLPVYKFLSPAHLLKEAIQNDSNTLDKNFYGELLYWMGLEEVREGSKTVIRQPAKPIPGTLTELILDQLSLDSRGVSEQDRWDVALELSLLWVNRLIFLKLLESQLLTYHNQDRHYRFLGPNDIDDFGELYKLFFGVLAIRRADRRTPFNHDWSRIPYMNSRLFELSPREMAVFSINQLDNNVRLTPPSKTVLKKADGTRDGSPRKTLDYLLSFLDAYDFSSEGTGEIQDTGKALINASVLGLIFEKINGYKEGSFFTPGYITQYMARQSVHAALLTKFREIKGWECADLTALHNHISPNDLTEANQVINSLKIVDPAVGSGHFLVSVLNELIAAKSELGILVDANGKRLRDYRVVVENDELFVVDEDGDFVTYHHPFGQGDRQMVWETLFREKRTLIENCLFGVDINPNSVQICKLRLWIELLKHSYYTPNSGFQDLETLPNLDIKIREGNSLVSRYGLNVSLSKISSREPGLMAEFLGLVREYQSTLDKAAKKDIETHIQDIKETIKADLEQSLPLRLKIEGVKDKLGALSQGHLFDLSEKEERARDIDRKSLEEQLARLQTQLGKETNNPIYRNSFEWRFEFPEVLDSVTGDFVGFDVVIGNPPYGANIDRHVAYFEEKYPNTSHGFKDIYKYFFQRSLELGRTRGCLNFITPNTYLRQPRYGDLRRLLLEYTILRVIDLGENIFDAVVPTCIIHMKKESATDSAVLFTDISRSKEHITSLFTCKSITISQDRWTHNHNVIFVEDSNFTEPNKLVLDNVLDFRDAGINYQRVNVGLSEKGKSDLSARLLYDGIQEHQNDIEYWKGADIDRYFIAATTKRFCRQDIELKANERLILNKSYFSRTPKLLWRQTASQPAVAIDTRGVWFGRSIQAAEIKTEFTGTLSYEYLCALMNSTLMKSFYEASVRESGRVFPQVKLEKLRFLPVVIPTKDEIAVFNKIVGQIVEAKRADPEADTRAFEAEIDQLVYRLYGLTEEEIRIVEEKPARS